jgi:hypothetical protein
MSTHLIIPDTQVKDGVPTEHLDWIGQYILERRPDVIIHVGDHWDMPSLSSWDRGKIQFEGRRYKRDIEVGNRAFKRITHAVRQFNYGRRRRGQDEYVPRWVFLRGNHEYRIERAVEEHAHLEGLIGYHDLDTEGWEVHDFLEPVCIDGVWYSHYFQNPMTGKPYGGTALTRLKTIGHSFTMGHTQTLDYALRFVAGRGQHALVAGACYLHEEDYKGVQGNAHWRGIIVKHQVAGGSYDPMFVSLDFLCRKYEGATLEEFVKDHYPDLLRSGWGNGWASP